MKLKEFRYSPEFKAAGIVRYVDTNGEEIEVPTTEVKRRRFYNREVVRYQFDNPYLECIQCLEVTLQ